MPLQRMITPSWGLSHCEHQSWKAGLIGAEGAGKVTCVATSCGVIAGLPPHEADVNLMPVGNHSIAKLV